MFVILLRDRYTDRINIILFRSVVGDSNKNVPLTFGVMRTASYLQPSGSTSGRTMAAYNDCMGVVHTRVPLSPGSII